MEINLYLYINPITRWKHRTFFLIADEMMYGNPSDKQIKMNSIHYELLCFPKYDQDKKTLVLPILHAEDYFLKSHIQGETNIIQNDNNDLELFRLFLIFYKFVHLRKVICYKMVEFYETSMSIEDIKKQISLISEKKTFYEILLKINDSPETKGMIDALRLKFEAYDEEINNIFSYKKIKTVSELKKDYDENIYNVYIDSKTKPEEYDLRQSILNKTTCNTSQIDQFAHAVYNHIKILNDIRISLLEIEVLEKKINIPFKNDVILQIIRNVIFTNKTNNNLGGLRNQLETINLKLNKEKITLFKTNIGLKEKLKEFLISSGATVFYCFRCGNILSKNSILMNSNCYYDEKCNSNSLFTCKKCKINFCTYCVQYYKNSKCYKNHVIFEFEGTFNKNCIICSKGITSKEYGCNICEYPLCTDCYIRKVQIKQKSCEKCKMEYLWKRATVSKCEKCRRTKECFWFCNFCGESICSECIRTDSYHCGVNHMLEKKTMDKVSEESHTVKLEDYENNAIWKVLQYQNPICSVCGTMFPYSYKVCKRCNYIVCNACQVENFG